MVLISKEPTRDRAILNFAIVKPSFSHCTFQQLPPFAASNHQVQLVNFQTIVITTTQNDMFNRTRFEAMFNLLSSVD